MPPTGVYDLQAIADMYGRTTRNIKQNVIKTKIPGVDWGDGLILFSCQLFEQAIIRASRCLDDTGE